MKYALNKREKKFELVSFPESIEGLDIVPKNKKGESPFEVKKITLVDTKLIKSYIMQIINKKFDKLIKLMNKVLSGEDEDSGENTQMALDEVQKLKSMLISKYKMHLIDKQYKELLSKIILMEEEFKVRYNERIMYQQLMQMNFTEEKGIKR